MNKSMHDSNDNDNSISKCNVDNTSSICNNINNGNSNCKNN